MVSTLSSVLENQACQEQCQKHLLAAVRTTYPEGRLSDNRGAKKKKKKEIVLPVETLSSSTRWSLTNKESSIKQSK